LNERPTRRFSEAISEGDGISLIVEVGDAAAAHAAAEAGAEAVFVLSGLEARLEEISRAIEIPILFFFDGERPDALVHADACIVDTKGESNRDWLEQVHVDLENHELALRVDDDEELTFVLEEFDPEILILAGGDAEGEEALERVLDLLPDVPAGKLAIAELQVSSREEVVALERAGVDGVIVRDGDVAELVGGAPPEV
jgi:hypothetical protein